MPSDERRFHRLEEHRTDRRTPLLAAPVGLVSGALLGGAAYALQAALWMRTGTVIDERHVPIAAACALIGAGFGLLAGAGTLWNGAWMVAFGASLLGWVLTGVLAPILVASGVPPLVTVLAGLGVTVALAQVVGRVPLPDVLQKGGSAGIALWMGVALPVHGHLLAAPMDGLAVVTTGVLLVAVSPLAVVAWWLAEVGRGPLLPAGAGAALAGGLVAAQVGTVDLGPPADALRPPVVVVVVQGLRADRLSRGGYERDVTPALDAFAERATHYTEAESTSSWSVPALGSLLTGRWPHHHGAGARRAGVATDAPLRADVVGWPAILGWNGYQVSAVSGDPTLAPYGLAAGFHRWDDAPELGPVPWLLEPIVAGGIDLGRFPRALGADEVTDRALAVLGADPGGKALLVVYGDAGGPFRHTDRELADVGLTTRPWPADDHDASLLRVDRAVGRLLEELPKEAIVVVVGDRGVRGLETRGPEQLWGHHLYPELTRVPLLLRTPASRARRISTPVSLVDVGPTLLSQAGVPVPEAMSGVVLQGASGGPGEAERALLASATRYGPHRRAVRRGNYRLIDLGDREALFDLGADPLQREALGQEPALDGIRRELGALLPADAADTTPVPMSTQLGRLFAAVVGGHR